MELKIMKPRKPERIERPREGSVWEMIPVMSGIIRDICYNPFTGILRLYYTGTSRENVLPCPGPELAAEISPDKR